MKTYCLLLDLVDDPALIAEYESVHRAVWPEILESIKSSGITKMEIYRCDNRLTMIIEATEDFSFEKKAEADANNIKVQEWEQLMWKYQQALPGSKPGDKWKLSNLIFSL
ncbi:L-rhamnose mutarotase [Mucilaginibacter sp. PAMB04168]|uniref:L-rhamnose mutarotase n=1 Tax=Mucilaginibacter sp. PAMB04168 TaxID=3138567 RepID=UPI0031F6E1B9